MVEMVNKGMDTYKRLLKVSKKYWVLFVIGMIATIFLSLTDAGFAWLIKPIVNEGFIARNNFFIRWLPILIILIFIVRSLSSFVSSYFVARVARSVVMDLRGQIFRHLMKLPAKFYDNHSSGKLISTILYNVEQVAQASSDALVTVLREFSLMISLVAVMFIVNWRLSLIFVVITPLIVWGIKICSTRLRRLSKNVQSSVAEVSHIANEGIGAYRVIRLFNGQDYEIKKFDRAIRENRHQVLKVEVTNSLGTAVMQLLISIPLAVVLFVATSPSLGVTAGGFASIISAMIMLIRPMRRMTNLNNFIQNGIAGAESIFALLDEEAEKDSGTKLLVNAHGNIEYKNVYFSYDKSENSALNNVNFKIEAGQTVAVVGYSGSGKSTLVSLLTRFYEVDRGEIKIDNIDIRDYSLADLRKQFAFVSQHTVLFNDSVKNNIAYAEDGEIDEERLMQSAKMAHAFDFINELPQGFDTIVGEDGLLLSGGQRQRIAIARALYKQAPILILDEATASLDTQAERQIQMALTQLMSRCTTLVIAHRLSTIENADWILVMDKGVVAEKGSHNELLINGGIYSDLYNMQFSESL